MKRLKILPLLSFLIVLILSSCLKEKNTDIPQPIKSQTNIDAKETPVFSTPVRTQDVTSKPMLATPSPSKTMSPRPVTTVTAGPTSTNILDGKLIILREFSVNYLEDIQTGRGYNLFAEGKSIDILRWGGNGCTIIVATRDGIIEMDLQGKILRDIFPFNRLPDVVDGHILIDPPYYRRAIDMLSPDESWVSYRIGSGSYEQRGDDIEPYRFKFENLETMSVDGTQGPYKLSQNGGAWRAAWSPDSQHIAYSDYDEQGIHQLFIISTDGGNRKQITAFTGRQVEIMKILWSPTGDKIALHVDQDGDGSDDETIVQKIDGNTPPKELINIFAVWWRDNNSFVAGRVIEQEPRHGELIILDTTTNYEFKIGLEGCYRINLFGNPSMVGCLTYDDKFVVYDTNTSNTVEYPNFIPLQDTQYWIAAPDSYPGIYGCGYNP